MHAQEAESAAEVVMTMLHAGGKFDHNAYKVSGGLHGVGVSVRQRALRVARAGDLARTARSTGKSYERGTPMAPLEMTGTTKSAARRSRSSPTPRFSRTSQFSFDKLSQRLREKAFLNKGVRITINDERDGKSHEFYYKGGIV